eukprot:CAMPEP_0184705446 /NCGR_PEP_ID=MMETSP0313-20130426/34384_1 /TAXON_ID=2792 /ORGANISM="Porphyridium aerugineum, Strain SAG 1380-2" /LENGTH=53 /DNA_ID=CAMNT_0027166795 /DNA_START=71 /DNA_END=228 /DNA_ORIENTATION=+
MPKNGGRPVTVLNTGTETSAERPTPNTKLARISISVRERIASADIDSTSLALP